MIAYVSAIIIVILYVLAPKLIKAILPCKHNYIRVGLKSSMWVDKEGKIGGGVRDLYICEICGKEKPREEKDLK